jgi:hypothetical protein
MLSISVVGLPYGSLSCLILNCLLCGSAPSYTVVREIWYTGALTTLRIEDFRAVKNGPKDASEESKSPSHLRSCVV